MAAKNTNRESIQNVIPTTPPLERDKTQTYGEILGDVGESLREIILSDFSLMLSELRQIQHSFGLETKKILVFGAILSVSFTPLVAASVIGLGIVMNGHYGWSSLIVGAILLLVGGIGFSAAYKRIKKLDMDFPKTKSALKEEGRAIQRELSKVRVAAKGESNELH